MHNPSPPLAPETEIALQANGGPLEIAGLHGKYVVMRLDVYDAMLGVSDNEDADTLASVRRGMADVDTGRTLDVATAFDQLVARYAS